MTPEAYFTLLKPEPNWDPPTEGGVPLLGHYLLVRLGTALKRGTKVESLNKNSRNPAKKKREKNEDLSVFGKGLLSLKHYRTADPKASAK